MFAIIKFIIIMPCLPPLPLPCLCNLHSAAFDRHDLIIQERCWHCCQQIAKRQKFQHKNSLKVTRGVGGDRDRERASAQWEGGGWLRKWEVTSSSCTIQLAESKAIMANRPWEQAQKKPLPSSCALSCHKVKVKHPVFGWICSLTLAWYFINHIRKL